MASNEFARCTGNWPRGEKGHGKSEVFNLFGTTTCWLQNSQINRKESDLEDLRANDQMHNSTKGTGRQRKRVVTERIYLLVKILPLFEVCRFDSKKEYLEDIYVAKNQLQYTTGPDSAQRKMNHECEDWFNVSGQRINDFTNQNICTILQPLVQEWGVSEFLDCIVPSNDRVTAGLGRRELRLEDLSRQR